MGSKCGLTIFKFYFRCVEVSGVEIYRVFEPGLTLESPSLQSWTFSELSIVSITTTCYVFAWTLYYNASTTVFHQS